MSIRGWASLVIVGLGFVGTTLASGAPVQWAIADGGNGHYYDRVDFITHAQTWLDSKTAAEALIYSGEPGYLATLTSAAENAFVYSQLLAGSPTLQYFIGGSQPAGSAEPAGGWTWITGEAWGFTRWYAQFQPDNNAYYNGENALSIYSGTTAQSSYWNDCPDDRTDAPLGWEPLGGYVVEYVPEPATCALLAVGGLALLRRGRTSPRGRTA